MIHLSPAIAVPCSRSRLEELLSDIPGTIECIPGAWIEERVGPDAYRGGIGVRYGDVAIRFSGAFASERENDGSVVVHASGEGGGQVSAAAEIRVTSSDDGGSLGIGITADLEFTGLLAPLANSAARAVGPGLMARFAERLAERLRSGMPAGGRAEG